jgi:hypothetical protein
MILKKSKIHKIGYCKKKIEYESVLRVDDALIKGEIRLMYLWPDSEEKPVLTTNGLRLTKDKIVNTQLNENSKWCGASTVFMQK